MIRIIRFTSVLQIIEIDIYQHYRIVYQNYQQQKKKKKKNVGDYQHLIEIRR